MTDDLKNTSLYSYTARQNRDGRVFAT